MRCTIFRLPRVLAALIAACLLLAGCGAGPSKVGSAAIVGQTAIPVSTVESRFTAVLDKEQGLQQQLRQQGRMDDLARRIAAFAVRQELVRQTARREGLHVSDQAVTRWIARRGGAEAASAGKIFTAENFRAVARSRMLVAELGRKYFDKLTVTFDYTQASTRQEARAKAERMARGPEQARALISADRAAGIPAGTGKRISAEENTRIAVGTPLFGAPVGTVLAFKGPAQRAGKWLVVRVTGRSTSNASDATAGSPRPEAAQSFGLRLLGMTAQRVGVRLSPRYGVWDPVQLTAAPGEGQTSGFRLPPPPSPA